MTHRSLAPLVAALAFCSCAPITAPGNYMRLVDRLPDEPPPGKSMVVFHRPRAHIGYPLYFAVWDRFELVGLLGNGHSTAYVCEPGKHTFIGRSAEIKTVVDAELLPGEVYDFTTRGGGFWIASFHLVPITVTDADHRAAIDGWLEEHRLVERVERDAELERYEHDHEEKLQTILREAREEGKLPLLELGPGDHR